MEKDYSMSQLKIPSSDATVRVRMIDTTAVIVVKAVAFIEPVQPGHELLNLPCAAFLIDHASSGRKIMFDLGVRKDYWKLPAGPQKRLGMVTPALRVDKDTTEILTEKGIGLKEISSVIWSHYHWDHTGSMELFPLSTELVVGPGFTSSPTLLPGYPHNPQSPIDSAATENRVLTEVAFDNAASPCIGGFRAHDFFGDGSFYLLDTPGHYLGHMCGLARTTGGSDSTFVLLGGDVCHFTGDFRPSPRIPLPPTIPCYSLDRDAYFPDPCPCSLFADSHPSHALGTKSVDPCKTPFYRISTHETAAYTDSAESQHSVDKLIDFDGSPSVLVCLAHDGTMLHSLPTLNNSPEDDLNDWKRRGYKRMIHWGWLNDLPRNGRPGRKQAVEGFWRDYKQWPEAQEVLCRNGEAAVSPLL